MATAERTAHVQWEGNLAQGNGELTLRSSQAAGPLPITWASRTERANGKTSPEELLAAANAACFSMALSHALAQAGHAPERLDVTATCTLDKTDDGFKVTTMKLTVRASVPGIDNDAFLTAARGAVEGCPISSAIRGNVDIQLDAALE